MTGIGIFMRRVLYQIYFPYTRILFFPPAQLNCMFLQIHIYAVTVLKKKVQ